MKTEDLLPPGERTLPRMLQRQARLFGARMGVQLPGASWPHDELAHVAARRGAALLAAGVQRGDRVAVMCGNRAEFLETVLGCGWIGAVSVPLNSACMGPQLEYLLADCGARLFVVEAGFVQRLHMADLSRTALQQLWVVGSEDAGAVPAGLQAQPWPAPGAPVEAAPVQPCDTFAILYTSGTTGPSKGVLCPHAQYYWWGVHSQDVLGLRPDDVLCTTLPLFHINALNTFAQACVVGCEVHFLDKFSASGFWPSMARAGATVVYLLGAMVPILLAQPVSAAERQHRVRIGLGPGVPEAAGQAFLERTGVTLLEGYGSTETNFVIATTTEKVRWGVMGWVRPGFQARVVDDADNELPSGVAGELLLRADEPFVFASGYFGKPDKTVEAWRNLWFHTGDRVVREPDGALRFVDRIKDAIRRRGENISSWEVEQVLMMHPSVATAAVYPVRSELAEDEVMAGVILREGASAAPSELAAFCATRLPRFAVPRFIELVDDLPRTENGKVQKYKLRERGVPPGCWDSAAKMGG